MHTTKLGGLGLVKISDFLIAQQCMWIKRASQSTRDNWRDNWRIDLVELSNGNAFTLNVHAVSQTEHPILKSIARSYWDFLGKFSIIGQNYKHSFILNNPVFIRGPKDNGILDYNFFGCGGPLSANLVSLATLKYGDCWEGNIFLSMEMLNERFNLGINAVV